MQTYTMREIMDIEISEIIIIITIIIGIRDGSAHPGSRCG